MEDVRCICRKLLCQTEEDKIIIKCRHCKRYIIIHAKGPLVVETLEGVQSQDVPALEGKTLTI